MSTITNIYFGKIAKIVDERTFLVAVNFLNQPDMGENGPKAMPLGFINTKVEIDDKILVFEVNKELNSYFYLPLKNDGQVSIYNKDTYIDLTDPDNLVIQSQKNTFQITKGDLSFHVNGKTYLIHDGEIYLQIKNKLTLSGPGQLEVKGAVIPDTTSYPLNTIPVCPITGLPHGGSIIVLTGTPPIPPQPPNNEGK